MAITLREIDKNNYYEVCQLTTNGDGTPSFDEEFICANAVSIAESKYDIELVPKAIYNDEELFGFILYGFYEFTKGAKEFGILRFMIDYKFQGKSFGRQALTLFLEEIKTSKKIKEIFLGLDLNNKKALQLYQSFGFEYRYTSEFNERIYSLTLD